MMHTHTTPRNSQPFKGNTQPLILLVIIFLVFTIMVASYVAYESSMNYLHTTFANFNPIPNGDGQRQFDLTSFFISINKHNSDGNHISESNMKTLTKQYVAEAVKVAEWQWKYQKWELDQNMYEKYNDNLKRYNPNYPCFLGEQVAGHVDITDGNKWVCGLSHIGHGFENIDNPDRKNHSCIIYSIGSRNNFQFEESILQNAPKHCQVHTFDPYSIYDHAPYHTRFHFHQIGVDYRDYVTTDNRHFQTIPDIMKSLNHQHIDILKIDVEGAEWPVFTKLNFSSNTWPIGQIQIEIHLKHKWYGAIGIQDDKTAIERIFQIFEGNGFRLFHKEGNRDGPACCIEYAFINHDIETVFGIEQLAIHFGSVVQH